jgi:hypothetical protein
LAHTLEGVITSPVVPADCFPTCYCLAKKTIKKRLICI